MIYWAKKQQPRRKRGVFYGDLPMQSKRVPFLQREKCAYIKMRRVGLSINQIAKAFGRSTSVIHRTLKRMIKYKTLRKFDMRKLPRNARMRMASFRWRTLMKLMPQWILWICEDSEKPP